jgi:AcrR family transcriptional regulator
LKSYMGRRNDHSKRELESLIVEAAFRMISEHGIDAISTRKIATEIGYTVGTLYHIFTNLDEIYVHVNAKSLTIFLDEAQGRIKNIADPKDKLRGVMQAYFDFHQNHNHLWRLLFEYQFPEDQQFPRWYNEKINEVFSTVAKIIGEITQDEAKAGIYTGIFWSTVHGMCSLSQKKKLQKIGFKQEDIADVFFDNFVKLLSVA